MYNSVLIFILPCMLNQFHFREVENDALGKENKNKGILTTDFDQADRKRKLSASSSEMSSLNKKVHCESKCTNGNDLVKPNDNQDEIEAVSYGEKVTEKPAKIKIAVKAKKRKQTSTDATLSKSENKLNVEDEEIGIFDDLDVKKMNGVQDNSVLSSSPDSRAQDTTCSKGGNEKANVSNTDKSSMNGAIDSLSNTPQISRLKGADLKICSPVVLEERKHRMKVEIAKLVVRINENKDDLDKYVERQEFLMAQEIKTIITSLEEEKLTLSLILEREDGKEISLHTNCSTHK